MKNASRISRLDLHRRFCSLYGRVADAIGVDDADCVCMSWNEEHEKSITVDARPIEFLERFSANYVRFILWAFTGGLVVGMGTVALLILVR